MKRYNAGFAGAAVVGLLVSGLAGTPAWASTTTNGNGTAVDVGIWFSTYNGGDEWADNFGKGYPVAYRPLDRFGNYSIPESDDSATIDFYLGKLEEAKIDFVILDGTNGGFDGTPYLTSPADDNSYIIDNAELVASRIQQWNSTRSWKIKYSLAVGGYSALCGSDPFGLCIERQAEAVLRDFYNSYGTSNYYQVNGEPLLIAYDWSSSDNASRWANYTGSKISGSQFTVRSASLGAPSGNYGWEAGTSTQLHPEVEVVMAGWNNHNGNTPVARAQGDHYTNAWNTVLDNPLPKIVVITSFNDYNEDTAVWTADTTNVVEPRTEQWDNHDGSLQASMYWDLTKQNIRSLRLQTDHARTGTATASSTYATLTPAKLLDGDRSSVYSSAAGNTAQHTEWVEVDLGAVRTFNTVSLTARSDMVGGFPRDFQIQVWNGSQWLTRVTVNDFVTPSPGATIPFSWGFSDTTNRVRVYATELGSDNNNNRILQLSALQVQQ